MRSTWYPHRSLLRYLYNSEEKKWGYKIKCRGCKKRDFTRPRGKKSVAKGWNMPLKIFYPAFELLIFHVGLAGWVPLSCQIGGSSFVEHLPLARPQPFNRETQHVPKATSKQPSIQWLVLRYLTTLFNCTNGTGRDYVWAVITNFVRGCPGLFQNIKMVFPRRLTKAMKSINQVSLHFEIRNKNLSNTSLQNTAISTCSVIVQEMAGVFCSSNLRTRHAMVTVDPLHRKFMPFQHLQACS